VPRLARGAHVPAAPDLGWLLEMLVQMVDPLDHALWRGEITLGYTGDGKRQRRKVSGTTRAAGPDKLRKLHADLDKGIVPKTGYSTYTVRQAAGG